MLLEELDWIPLFDEYFTGSGRTIVIIGAKRSGKTALAFRLGELAQKLFKREVYLFETRKIPGVPFKLVDSLSKVPPGVMLIVDEASIRFSSRRAFAKANVEVGNILAISGHKDLTTIFVAQSSGMMDINILRLADTVFVKEPSLFQAPLDRSVFYDVLVAAKHYFAMADGYSKRLFIAFSDKYYNYLVRKYANYTRVLGLAASSWLLRNYAILRCLNELPSFWSEMLSKRFRDYGLEMQLDPKMRKRYEIVEGTMKLKTIAKKSKMNYNTVEKIVREM
ncbi:MAG: hypothetical protein DRN81_04125, partial [Thermoproteota archaeon]